MQHVPEVTQKSLALQVDMQINVAIEPWHWWSERNRIRGREKRNISSLWGKNPQEISPAS
jgi:hypothetical protein